MVWPQAFIVNNKLQPVLNTQLLESATVTSTEPQTVVYKINPKAVWSDGTPITADDFIYNWQAQSGNPAYTDVGGKPYDDASTAGYNQIAVGRRLATLRWRRLRAGHRGGPQRRPVPERPHRHGDLQAVLRRLAQPVHRTSSRRTSRRTVGWNTGFAGPTQTISGSWYEIQSYNDEPVAGAGAEPDLLGHARASWTRSSSSSSRTTASWCRRSQNNEINIINPSTREPLHRADGQPGAGHDEGDAAGPRVRALRLQPGRPVPGQAPGPRGDRPRRRTARASSPAPSVRSRRASSRWAAACSCRPRRATRAPATPTNLAQSNQPAEGGRLQEGLGRLLPAQLRAAEGQGPDLHDPVDVGQQHPGRRPRSCSRRR